MSTPAPRTLRAAFIRLADDLDALLNWGGTLTDLQPYPAARRLIRRLRESMRRLDGMINAAEGKR